MRNWSKCLYGKFTESIRNLPRPPRPVQEGPYGPIWAHIWAHKGPYGPQPGPGPNPDWAPTRPGPGPCVQHIPRIVGHFASCQSQGSQYTWWGAAFAGDIRRLDTFIQNGQVLLASDGFSRIRRNPQVHRSTGPPRNS